MGGLDDEGSDSSVRNGDDYYGGDRRLLFGLDDEVTWSDFWSRKK